MKNIYLDNSATTVMCREALEKYTEIATEKYGNPSSLHALGYDAEREIEAARGSILKTVSAEKCKLVFTSSGTEANNLAIIGRALSKERYKRGARIITTMGEHASVSEPFEMLSKMGFKVAYVGTRGGEIDLEQLERELTDDVILVSVMMVNNETGAVYNLPRVAKIIKKSPEALFHVDATQGYMKIPFSKAGIGADMITLSSHKISGPKGVGALVIDPRVITAKGLSPLILGGGQQIGLRSGTENVPGIAAFGAAASLRAKTLTEDVAHMDALRSYLLDRLRNDPGLSEIRPTTPKLHAPHILNITLPNIKSETMLHYLSSLGIYISSGSACSSNSSHVSSALTAYGHSPTDADCSVRISFCPENTKEDVDALCDALAEGLSHLVRIK